MKRALLPPLLCCGALLALALTGCRNEAACRVRCLKLGIQPQSQECTTLCTTSCSALQRDYGMSEAHCAWMQTGEKDASPGAPIAR